MRRTLSELVRSALVDRALEDARRLAFGRVAEQYDLVRPSYPEAMIDDLIAAGPITPPGRLLDVGAGTGKLTRLLAERGFGVLALEPSPSMASVAQRHCAEFPLVDVAMTDFEHWRGQERFGALVSAQAWHWITPELRYRLAARALTPGGVLAAIWTFPDWGPCQLRDALREVYRSTAAELTADFPMHPDSRPTSLASDWEAEIHSSEGFAHPQVITYPWTCTYSAREYVELVGTHQDHILLEASDRARLFEAIKRTIAGVGGCLEISYVTRLCLARRR